LTDQETEAFIDDEEGIATKVWDWPTVRVTLEGVTVRKVVSPALPQPQV
jgi:hypothetical protein